MTVSLEIETEIRRLSFAEHWPPGTIATSLGIHPDVVNRCIHHYGPKDCAPRPHKRVIEPYLDFIDATLNQYPRLLCTRIYDMLRQRGYRGSLRSVRRHVQRVRPRPRAEAVLRTETFPGEQAQVDWTHVGEVQVDGGRRALWAFVAVLAHSRASFAELVFTMDVPSLRRSLVRASLAFGGSPRQWLFDNAKPIVIGRTGDLIQYHPELLAIAAALHVQPRLCAPRRPQEKGKVERTNRYFKDRFFAARTFHSLEHGNAQLTEFIHEIANKRPHPRWPTRSVEDVFASEKPYLLPLPDPLPTIDHVTPVRVDTAAFVRLDTNRYSVPHTYAGRGLTMVSNEVELRFLDGMTEVARHKRSWGRDIWREHDAHREELVQEKRAAKDLKGRDRLRAEIPGIEVIFARWMDHGCAPAVMVSRTIQLLNSYGAGALRDAVVEMTARGTHDPGAMAVLCEARRTARGERPLPVMTIGAHVRERDVAPHDLGGYDD